MSWDAMVSEEAAMERIKADHKLAQARYETLARRKNKHLAGFTALNEGHRLGFWDGVAWVLHMQARYDSLTSGEALAELRKGEGSIYFALKMDDPRFHADCPTCDRPVLIDVEGICDRCGFNFDREQGA